MKVPNSVNLFLGGKTPLLVSLLVGRYEDFMVMVFIDFRVLSVFTSDSARLLFANPFLGFCIMFCYFSSRLCAT